MPVRRARKAARAARSAATVALAAAWLAEHPERSKIGPPRHDPMDDPIDLAADLEALALLDPLERQEADDLDAVAAIERRDALTLAADLAATAYPLHDE